MQRDNEYLLDILEAAKLAIAYIGEKSRDEFFVDSQCQDAVIRRLEIIGEATRRVSEETRTTWIYEEKRRFVNRLSAFICVHLRLKISSLQRTQRSQSEAVTLFAPSAVKFLYYTCHCTPVTEA